MTDKNAHSDLLLLTQAAHAAFMSRGNFNLHAQKQLVPPPAIDLPRRRWSEDQIKRQRLGQIKSNDDGVWVEWDPEIEDFRKLPNQYKTPLPKT